MLLMLGFLSGNALLPLTIFLPSTSWYSRYASEFVECGSTVVIRSGWAMNTSAATSWISCLLDDSIVVSNNKRCASSSCWSIREYPRRPLNTHLLCNDRQKLEIRGQSSSESLPSLLAVRNSKAATAPVSLWQPSNRPPQCEMCRMH